MQSAADVAGKACWLSSACYRAMGPAVYHRGLPGSLPLARIFKAGPCYWVAMQVGRDHRSRLYLTASGAANGLARDLKRLPDDDIATGQALSQWADRHRIDEGLEPQPRGCQAWWHGAVAAIVWSLPGKVIVSDPADGNVMQIYDWIDPSLGRDILQTIDATKRHDKDFG